MLKCLWETKSISKQEVNFLAKLKCNLPFLFGVSISRRFLMEKFSTHVGISFQIQAVKQTTHSACPQDPRWTGAAVPPFRSWGAAPCPSTAVQREGHEPLGGMKAKLKLQHDCSGTTQIKLVNGVWDTATQRDFRRWKGRNAATQLGHKQTLLETAQRLKWCKTSESYAYPLLSHNHTN